MAQIRERISKQGVKTYQVRLRRNGFKPFMMTFPSKKEAEDWVLLHEDKYYEKPEKYITWLKGILQIARAVKKREII